ncbi:MAG TPA: hypothetical protein PLL69_01935 [Gemmatimonadales bacterium]|nr:hypothetical protein [Gemmatimonadales bacterium]
MTPDETPSDDRERPAAVLAATGQPVPLEVREIEDDRVPEGMRCLGTFLDGNLVARCAVPPGAAEFIERNGMFAEPRQLVLAAREEDPGLRCELYALIPLPEAGFGDPEDQAEGTEPWAGSVPSSSYEEAVARGEDEDEATAAILLGQIVRFARDRRHPDSLPLETVDVLERIVSGRVVEVVDKVLEDLLGNQTDFQ